MNIFRLGTTKAEQDSDLWEKGNKQDILPGEFPGCSSFKRRRTQMDLSNL